MDAGQYHCGERSQFCKGGRYGKIQQAATHTVDPRPCYRSVPEYKPGSSDIVTDLVYIANCVQYSLWLQMNTSILYYNAVRDPGLGSD